MISRLFRTKSIEQILADADHPDHRLKKTLTAWDLTALGIGAIIGTRGNCRYAGLRMGGRALWPRSPRSARTRV